MDALFAVTDALNRIGTFLSQLALRLVLAWEFWLAGQHKLHGAGWHGADWLATLAHHAPLPFAPASAASVWFLVTWVELLGAIALLVGFGTRFAALVLIVLEVVAWITLHGVVGYGGDRPLLYLAMLVPLLFSGPGRASLDHWIVRRI
jgi:putative oxidoreductase